MGEGKGPSGDKVLEVPVVVRFGDTDPYGVVYFASYFRYCHQGIEELFRSRGLSPERVFRNREEGYGLPVVGAQCDFFKPVRYGETLSLQVRVVRWGSKSATFGFRFYNGAGELAADGRATLAAIDRNWRSRPWPEALRKALEAFSTEV